MLIQYVFFNNNHSHNHCFFNNMIIVIAIITAAFIEIVISETTIVAILKRKNTCLQPTLEKLIVMFKVNNKYTKNNINETALLLALNIALFFS